MLTNRFFLSPKGAHNAAMTWLVSRIEFATKRDEIHLSHGASTAIYDSIRNLRMLMARLPDMYDGRMNIAYIHFVNMLVSTLVLVRVITLYMRITISISNSIWLSISSLQCPLKLSPLALFPAYRWWAIPSVGIFSLFYVGILTLSMVSIKYPFSLVLYNTYTQNCSTFCLRLQMFLDPVDNDTKHNKTLKQTAGLDVGVLIREVRIYETWYLLHCLHILEMFSFLSHTDISSFICFESLIGSEW